MEPAIDQAGRRRARLMSDARQEGLPDNNPVRFHYIKGNDFRVVHVDGAIGSITPRGLIHAALYSERMPIPQLLVHPVGPDGSLMPATEVESRQGVVREIEIGLMLDRQAADSLRVWLTDRIAELDKAVAMANSARQTVGTP